MAQEEFLRVTDAAQRHGISRTKLWRLIKEGKLQAFEDPRDARTTLIRSADLARILQIKPKL